MGGVSETYVCYNNKPVPVTHTFTGWIYIVFVYQHGSLLFHITSIQFESIPHNADTVVRNTCSWQAMPHDSML